MERNTSRVRINVPPVVMNTFVNEAFEEHDEKIEANNNNDWINTSTGVESYENDDMFATDMKMTMLSLPSNNKGGRDRKVSQICAKAAEGNRRKQNLVEIRESIVAISTVNTINQAQLQTLLSDRNFCLIFFRLFDEKGSGILEQSVWFGKLKYWYQANIGEKNKGGSEQTRFH